MNGGTQDVGIQDVRVRLDRGPDGRKLDKPVLLYVQTRRDSGEVEVSSHIVDGLQNVLDAIAAVSSEIAEVMRAVRPDRFCVELGFEIKAEAGGLVAMLVRAGGTATVQVTLEWQKTTPPAVVPAAAPAPSLSSPPL